jgi:hypothetical protein
VSQKLLGAIKDSGGVSLALLRDLNDQLCKRQCHRITAINQSKLAQRGLICAHKMRNVLRPESYSLSVIERPRSKHQRLR